MVAVGGRRRSRQVERRPFRLRVTLTAQELELIADAAGRAGLAKSAFVAEAALAAARGEDSSSGRELRQALVELMRAAGLVRRAGVNLNQAVRTLNATGDRPADLEPAAAWCMRVVRRLDAAGEAVRRLLP